MAKSNPLARAIACYALKAHFGRKADRSLLDSDRTYEAINLKVSGKIGQDSISETVIGRLDVGDDNPSGSTSKPKTELLVADLLGRMPKTRLAKFITDVESKKELPSPPVEHVQTAKHVIEQLSTTSMRRGSVSFVSKD